ncbi:hypothetical protein D3C81_1960280 [compost metagenome]
MRSGTKALRLTMPEATVRLALVSPLAATLPLLGSNSALAPTLDTKRMNCAAPETSTFSPNSVLPSRLPFQLSAQSNKVTS